MKPIDMISLSATRERPQRVVERFSLPQKTVVCCFEQKPNGPDELIERKLNVRSFFRFGHSSSRNKLILSNANVQPIANTLTRLARVGQLSHTQLGVTLKPCWARFLYHRAQIRRVARRLLS